jgi:glutamate synthase domain-containing protein 3
MSHVLDARGKDLRVVSTQLKEMIAADGRGVTVKNAVHLHGLCGGLKGGEITIEVVKGSAGDFTATMNKGATVIIGQDVGDEVGTYMLAGDLVIVGNAGHNLGNYLIRGNIYVGGQWTSLGHNIKEEPLTEADVDKLQSYLSEYAIEADPRAFRKLAPLSEKPFYK